MDPNQTVVIDMKLILPRRAAMIRALIAILSPFSLSESLEILESVRFSLQDYAES